MSTLNFLLRNRPFRSDSARLTWIDWRLSLLLPIGVLLVIATVLFRTLQEEPEIIDISIRSSMTDAPLDGAMVRVGSSVNRADADGRVRLERPSEGAAIEVSAEGYRSRTGSIEQDSVGEQIMSLQPSTVQGTVTDTATGEPIAGVAVSVLDAAGSEVTSSMTDAGGGYLLHDVPADGVLLLGGGEYGAAEHSLGQDTVLDLALRRQIATGRILDDAGNPIPGAIVQSQEATSVTAGDGTFEIVGVAPGSAATVMASGFESQEFEITVDGVVPDVQLTAQIIRGLYANRSLLAEPGGLEELIDIANTTEINAIVIDIKQDSIYYDSNVPFFEDAGSIAPIYDIQEVLAKLEENDIYAIARLVVFQDPLVAEARPDLAVLDETTGGLWRNDLGVAWVNAFHEELWDANIALALEALEYGFDEIQYDYVRFPSDGDLSTADFGREYTAEAREAAITSFMKRSYEAIHAVNGKLAADLFGFVTLVDDEQYIGQRFSALEPYLDYVCMMIYPSHFEEGNIASAPGHPNDYPYETILESLERAEALVPGSSAKFRPWLQDFSYGGMRDYTVEDVRAQIDAAEDFGTNGWMLWGDPFNVTVEALDPESGG